MTDLADGESIQVQGSGATPYTLKNSGGMYSCTCPAWRNQSVPIERRTCKHLRSLRGDDAEKERTGNTELAAPVKMPKRAPDGSEVEGSEPPLLLAHRWENHVDLTGYWLSEKLDGVRAYWDGKQFWSRLGNKFYAPSWFTAGLPDSPLDGELWGGRKQFQRTVGIVKRQDENELWRDLLFVVFDAPAHGGLFEARIAHCEALFTPQPHPYVRIHLHEPCKGVEHLKEELTRVEALGGEGLMARKPASAYEAGRSHTLLKVKTFHDAEARIIDYAPGAGRHKGRVGALIVELEDGTRFNVGTGLSDQEREHPPAKGSLITFRYQELSDGGVPRFPSYVGVRIDGKWKGESAPPVELVVSRERVVAATSAAAVSTPVEPSHAARYFELVDGKSHKFWEIQLEGAAFTTRYGKLGTAGQQTRKEYDSPSAASRECDKLVAEKTKKGYVERK